MADYVVLAGNPADGFTAYRTDDTDFDRDLFPEWWILPLNELPDATDPDVAGLIDDVDVCADMWQEINGQDFSIVDVIHDAMKLRRKLQRAMDEALDMEREAACRDSEARIAAITAVIWRIDDIGGQLGMALVELPWSISTATRKKRADAAETLRP